MGSAAIQGELWGQASSDWALLQEPKHIPLFEAMLDAGQVGGGAHVFDAGCGGGGASVIAVERGAQVSGLDAAEPLIGIARKRVPSGDFRVGDLQALPFEDAVFDAVIAANSVQYAGDRLTALRELGRVCKPEGRVVVGLFGPAERVEYRAIFKAVRDALPEPPSGDGPFGLSAPGKLESLIEEAGLTILEQGEVDCPFFFQDFDVFWRATASAGPLRAALRAVGEPKLRAALQKATEAFRAEDGSVRIAPNHFKYIAARRWL
ncbi:MAG: methyltransferase domain-containing protein [Anaerolineae bacterium]|nr:methyltransferase domain-containing protein [Anaerolineae bacterium]